MCLCPLGKVPSANAFRWLTKHWCQYIQIWLVFVCINTLGCTVFTFLYSWREVDAQFIAMDTVHCSVPVSVSSVWIVTLLRFCSTGKDSRLRQIFANIKADQAVVMSDVLFHFWLLQSLVLGTM